MPSNEKYLGVLVEYLNDGRVRSGLVVREQPNQVIVLDNAGHERSIARDLILLRHPERKATRENLPDILAALDEERQRLATELDLNLLWEVVRDHGRGYNAEELADLFFGHHSTAGTAVMLEALFNDRLYFIRRNLEFVARSADQVERLRIQHERIKLRSEAGRRTRSLIRAILEEGSTPPAKETVELIAELKRYLENPFTRNRELTATLEAAVSDISAAEAAYEILERLDAVPEGPRFAVIGGVRTTFSDAVLAEARMVAPPDRPLANDQLAIAIDDEDTVEVDDAISCEPTPDGGYRVRVHIALVADYVPKGSATDKEAAARGSTVYLPETTIRMLPDCISTDAASLSAAKERHVLTTDIQLSSTGELISYSLAPGRLRIAEKISYDRADRLLCQRELGDKLTESLLRLHEAAVKMRERRRSAGAVLVQRREPKVSVVNGEIDVKVIDNASPSRQLVAEFMVISNHAAARFATDRNIPMIYRVQPGSGGDLLSQRPHLSLYPEFHAGVGLDCYLQASSPIRRYMDLVLQRQLIAAISEHGASAAYLPDELLNVLAAAESTESEGKELERRAKRYWILRYLERHAVGQELEAIVFRDGASAELEAYAVRGSLHGAPNVASQTRVLVQIARIEPVRGWLTMDYLGPVTITSSEGAH